MKLFTIARTGCFASLVYIGAIAWLRWPFSIETLRVIPINEFGDFFAGVFGPLALFWFILAFFLQKAELKQSRDALLLQAKELNNSVKQQEELVAVTREQMETEIKSLEMRRDELERDTLPNFVIEQITTKAGRADYNTTTGQMNSTWTYYIVLLINDGSPASDVVVEVKETETMSSIGNAKRQYLSNLEKLTVRWNDKDSAPPNQVVISVKCSYAIGKIYSKEFVLQIDQNFNYKYDSSI